MVVKVHNTSSTPGSSNTGSVANLVDYLEKESDSLEGGYFFGRTKESDKFDEKITRTQAIRAIDENVKGIRSKDAKFYMLTVNFSGKEQQHMAEKVTGRKVKNIGDMNSSEKQHYEQKMKDYTQKVMGAYAENFGRGIAEKDLIYVSKIEHERTYKGTDPAVLDGSKKSGEKKEGFQTHIHIVVSRKDRSQELSLSPHAKERIAKDNHMLNGKHVTKGFNHETFKLRTEKLFDKAFYYDRKYQESYASKSNTPILKDLKQTYKKHSTPREYKQMKALSEKNTNMVLNYMKHPSQTLKQQLHLNVMQQISTKEQITKQQNLIKAL